MGKHQNHFEYLGKREEIEPKEFGEKFKCRMCGEEKHYNMFSSILKKIYNECKSCIAKKRHAHRVSNYPRHFYMMTMWNHKVKGQPIKLKYEDFLTAFNQTETCPICGKILDKDLTQISAAKIALDRINEKKPYTKNNLQLICHSCNTKKRFGNVDKSKYLPLSSFF